jgi:pyruvate formate lyase activating enzyme
LAFADDTHELIRNENTCTGCFACASACPARAIGIYGKIMSLEDVMRRIRRDEIFYHYSGGGVTLSGGDVLCQADFARNILKSCKEESIGTTAELDMYGSYDKVSMLMAYLDSYYVDIKWLYDNRHREWTGVSGAGILDNIRRSSNDYPHKPLYARMPLIPGVNDSMENIRATVRFCASLKNCRGLEFLPYHRLGVSTYAYIGRPYRFPELPSMTLEEACSKIEFLPISALPFEITISGKRISG